MDLIHGYIDFVVHCARFFSGGAGSGAQNDQKNCRASVLSSVKIGGDGNDQNDLTDSSQDCDTNTSAGLRKYLLPDTHNEGQVVGSLSNFGFEEIFLLVVIVVVMTGLKSSLVKLLKNSKFVDRLGLKAKDKKRLEECIWRLSYYAISSACLTYVCFIKRDGFKYLATREVIDYSFRLDLDETIISLVESGFYLHAIYALVCEDVWRRDSIMMLVHHFAAFYGIFGFHVLRLHKIGLASVFLRDSCDVIFETFKLLIILKYQDGKLKKNIVTAIKVLAPFATFIFFYNQLYLWPVFGIVQMIHQIELYNLKSTVTNILVFCAIFVLLLDWVWFRLLIRLLYSIIFTDKPPRDEREYEDEPIAEETQLGQQEDSSKTQ